MSILGKNWVIQNQNQALNVVAKLLENRGITTPEKADWFFKGDLDRLHDPYLLKDMKKAVDRVKKAVDSGESIMIFGDYDVDGITGAVILYDFLQKVGANVKVTLPHREDDGYGMKPYFMERFKEAGIDLIITVDCGTSNLEEIKLANELGIDVVVTDHHSLPAELPPAVAIVNPHQTDCNYPNKEACGSTIAYKLVTAMAPLFWDESDVTDYLNKQLSVACLGVVGDCMELKGENRILVREGLKRLAAGDNPGLTELLKEAGIDPRTIDSGTIGFQIGPRINAAGRLDTPMHAFELLTGDLSKAQVLNELNNQRRELTTEYFDEACGMIDAMTPRPTIIALKSAKWKAGLIGLLAGKLTEKYGRPSIVMHEKDSQIVGSMRSLNNFDITGAVRQSAEELFTAFGGHAMAGGFTLPAENYDEFICRLNKYSDDNLDPAAFKETLSIDCEIESTELSLETVNKLSLLKPFGMANAQPVLMVKNARITDLRIVGKTQEHAQIPVEIDGRQLSSIAFFFARYLDQIDMNTAHDLVVNLEANEWNGRKKVQLKVIDMRPSER